MFLTYILPTLLYRDGHAHPVHSTRSSNVTPLPSDIGVLAVINSTNRALPPRTLFGVGWSCVITIFICAWTSVHPNVPPRGLMGGLLARFKLMFWTIVAPELVLAWAVRQRFAAREIRDLINQHVGKRRSKRWTLAHGHFLQMGGFMLVSDNIHQLEEPEAREPEGESTDAYRLSYKEYVRQRERCQLGTLTLERLRELVGGRSVVLPAITTAQIKDRSKGDGLSKLLTILQTSWFILQCVARGVQGLAITELELVTLAMASLNAITFAFWWSKPLGVQVPVDVYLTIPAGEKVNQTQDVEDEFFLCTAHEVIDHTQHHLGDFIEFILYPQRRTTFRSTKDFFAFLAAYLVLLPIALVYVLTYPVFLLFPLGSLFLLWVIKAEKVEEAMDDESVAVRVVRTLRKLQYKLAHSIRRYFGRLGNIDEDEGLSFIVNWFIIMPASFFLLVFIFVLFSPFFTIFFVASFIFTAAFGIVTTKAVRPGATHVPPFYAPRTKSDNYSRMVVFAIFGVIFGGIHCIGWNFAFPTRVERSLWRYTSMLLTAIPLVVAPIDYILENFNLKGTVGKKLRLLLGISMIALLFLYVPARLLLIIQAVTLLRDQPAAAFVAIDWTKYIPHLFT